MNDHAVVAGGSRFCFNETDDSTWLRHSLALDTLWQPSVRSINQSVRITCGTMSFAAAARLKLDAAMRFFPEIDVKPWINRTMMERALRSSGRQFTRRSNEWPAYGLCLVHFIGPWTQRAYPVAMLPHTHWIAVDRDYVFDVNWNGWLPKKNWEEVVLDELLATRPRATGWEVMTGYEILEHLSQDELILWADYCA